MFQSTHPHGVRRGSIISGTNILPRFNPRTHTGCDTCFDLCFQSIIRFQSTHPHGVRHSPVYSFGILILFQSTHPHGVRLISHQPLCQFHYCFNPRTHTGCDLFLQVQQASFAVFQSTHPHGVRLGIQAATNAMVAVSIHAPTRGATRMGE